MDLDLEKIQAQLILDAVNTYLQENNKDFYRKNKNCILTKVIFGSKKYRDKHLSLGDQNTKYYHAFAAIRRNKNQIKTLIDASGQSASNPDVISHILQKNFTIDSQRIQGGFSTTIWILNLSPPLSLMRIIGA